MTSKIKELIHELCPGGVEYKPLREVCDFMTGFAFKASTFVDSGLSICRTTNIQDGYIDFSKMVCFDKNDYKENLEKYIIRKDDIVIGMSGTIKIGINRSHDECYLNQRVGKFLPKEPIYYKFLYYILCNSVDELSDTVGGGSVKNLSNKDINDFKIPVPPLEVQKEIVKVLDYFMDYSTELQAELQARIKQYEYYRAKLLTFKELSAQGSIFYGTNAY